MQLLTGYRRLLILVALILLSVGAVTQHESLRPLILDRVVPEIMRPLQQATSAASEGAAYVAAWLEASQRAFEEQEELRERLAEFDRLEQELRRLESENERLRRLLDLREWAADEAGDGGVVIVVEVVGRNSDTWFEVLTINQGASDGVEVGMVALVPPRALVGRVTNVTANTAQVMLLLDPESAVGAVVEDSGESGIVFGGLAGDQELVMRFFSRDVRTRRHNLVVTSGLGGNYPRGLLIGTVQGVRENPMTNAVEAIVQPAAEFNRLDELVIVRGPQLQAGEEND